VAIVTGAGRGLGRAHAQVLAERGAKVVVNDLGCSREGTGADDTPALAVVEEIRAAGGEAVADGSDISDAQGADELVAVALREFGRVDIVVNNAGIIRWTEFPDANLGELERHYAVHGAGTFNVSRSAWPHMTQQGYGRFVNTTSTAVLGTRDMISYGAAKGGVLGLSRALADAGRAFDIGVNMISPMASTRMSSPDVDVDRADDPARHERPPRLVSAVVAFLAHESCVVTGEMYVAGSGRVSRLFVGATVGYTDPALTPEAVAEHWAAIQDTAAFDIPSGTISHGLDFDRGTRTAIAALQAP
jgi:NAD(P)-dependent dehydrogenase (short-subunit alcohol dehydrogenase family)